MSSLVQYFFGKWWRPILFWFLSCWIFVISELWGNRSFSTFASIIFGLGVLAMLVAFVYNLAKRRWLTGIICFGICAGTVFLLIMYSVTMFWIRQSSADTWADNLEIPKNIAISLPVDLDFDDHRPDSLINRTVTEIDFQLYNSFQPGLYEYDLWMGTIEKGTVYLKAFEITQEYALSTDRLSESSSIEIYNPTDSVKRFGTDSHFTIYEGDWGKPYAARFEVWFKPGSGEKERKLFERNYKIEGWMR